MPLMSFWNIHSVIVSLLVASGILSLSLEGTGIAAAVMSEVSRVITLPGALTYIQTHIHTYIHTYIHT